jgi:hypothetical protein
MIRRRDCGGDCAACKAKDQTIALLADLVDWHRAQAGQMTGSATVAVAAAPPMEAVGEKPEPTPEEQEIDSLINELNYGDIDPERAEQLTARLQTLTRA